MSNWMFKLRGDLTQIQSLVLGFVGFLLFLVAWWIAAEVLSDNKPLVVGYNNNYEGLSDDQRDSLEVANKALYDSATEFEKTYPVLPPPNKVLSSFVSVPRLLAKLKGKDAPTLDDKTYLVNDDDLMNNVMQSVWINLQGYIWAVLISIPLGFLIGLFPLFRGLFSKQVDAARYLPLSALVGLFVAWFGIYSQMKIAFLAFGIIVYLLPVIVQRINEVEDVYLKTVFTLDATNWQTIKSVYFPSVMSKVMDDMRVLTAISWTYIIIAELVNRAGGVGSLIYIKARQGQLEKVFGILIVIIFIGFIQDQVFKLIDRKLFPHKNYKSMLPGLKESRIGVLVALGGLLLAVMISSFFGLSAMVSKFIWLLVLSAIVITIFGEFTTRKALDNA